MKTAVVVPTNRPELFAEFAEAWEPQLRGRAELIVMEDDQYQRFATPAWMHHYSHEDVPARLDCDWWLIPRRSSACRSFGTLMALDMGADVIWHLDDDCRPEPGVDYLGEITRILSASTGSPLWWNTIRHPRAPAGKRDVFHPRGFPYGIRTEAWPVMIHHGLWSHVPDLDGRTQLEMPDLRLPPAEGIDVVPSGAFFPMCGMNLAFRAEAAPLFYMGLQGADWPFDRFDDMWAGLFAKKTADHLGWAVTSGAPSVRHDRASDAQRNALIEAPGIEAHEQLWLLVAETELTGKTAAECYAEIAAEVLPLMGTGHGRYWLRLAEAMRIWSEETK